MLEFLKKEGIDTDRLVAEGSGMEKSVADNTTETGRSMNRRLEFTILEKQLLTQQSVTLILAKLRLGFFCFHFLSASF